MSHRHLKEHVDAILRARLGSDFPAEGVGKNWTSLEKHSEQLKAYNPKSLEGI